MFPALYAILDPTLSPMPPVELAELWADAGVRLIQLRDKRASAAKLYTDTRNLVACVAERGVRIIVNDRADVAALAEAGGVHVGQDDLPVEAARRVCGSQRWVGVSTHGIDQLCEAAATSADYIAVGPVFPTVTKENPDPVVGLALLREARKLTSKPLVAIGGITLESAAEVFRAGADSVAVIRDLVSVTDPAMRAREYLAVAERARSER